MTGSRNCRCLALACIVVAGSAVLCGQGKAGDYTIEHETKTSVLTVEATEELPSMIGGNSSVKVKLRNTSTSETVTAVVLSLDGRPYYCDFAAARPLVPDETKELLMVHQPGESHERTIRVLAVLLDNGAQPDGDPAAIEYIRYARFGKLAESMRVIALLKQIDHLSPDDSTIDAVGAAANETAASPEAVLSGLSQVTGATESIQLFEKRLAGASVNASRAFISGSEFRRMELQNMMEKLKQLRPFDTRPGRDRASYLSAEETKLQRRTAELQSVIQRDLGASR